MYPKQMLENRWKQMFRVQSPAGIGLWGPEGGGYWDQDLGLSKVNSQHKPLINDDE